MTIKSGILKADVDKNSRDITQFLVVIDKKTGEPLRHPRLDQQATPVSVDVAGGQVVLPKLDEDGRIVSNEKGDEIAREVVAGLDIELHWIDDTPDWIVKDYSNQELPEADSVEDVQPFSDTNAGGENDPDPDAPGDEPVMEAGVWKWGPGGEDIGPAELHDAGLCDSETCDWCGEEEENGDAA